MNKNIESEGLVQVHRTGPVQIGEVIYKNGVLIQNGFAINEDDSIVFGNAVIHDLQETMNQYIKGYINCAKFISIESYLKRVKYFDGFEILIEGSDAHVVLVRFYSLLESTLVERYASIGKKKEGSKK